MATKKKIIITQKINNVIYEVMPKTHSDMVFVDRDYTENLSNRLERIAQTFTQHGLSIEELQYNYNAIVDDAPEQFASFKEVYDYLQSDYNPVDTFYNLIGGKRTADEYPDLSNAEYFDLLYAKLVAQYDNTEIDQKFTDLATTINQSLNVLDNKIDTAVENLNQSIENVRTELTQQIEDSNSAYVGYDPPEGNSDKSTIWYKIERDSESDDSGENIDDPVDDEIDDNFPSDSDGSSSNTETPSTPSNPSTDDPSDIEDPGTEIIDGDDPVDDEL